MLKKLSLLLLVTIASISCSTKPKPIEVEEKTTPAVELNQLPYLSGRALSGGEISFRDLPGNAILIVFFADCDHCQREATAIRERIDAFKKYQLYFISSSEQQEILKFAKDYKLDDQSNVQFVKADAGKIVQTFGAIPTPSVYIYSSEKKLVKQFNGETNIEEIIKFL